MTACDLFLHIPSQCRFFPEQVVSEQEPKTLLELLWHSWLSTKCSYSPSRGHLCSLPGLAGAGCPWHVSGCDGSHLQAEVVIKKHALPVLCLSRLLLIGYRCQWRCWNPRLQDAMATKMEGNWASVFVLRGKPPSWEHSHTSGTWAKHPQRFSDFLG